MMCFGASLAFSREGMNLMSDDPKTTDLLGGGVYREAIIPPVETHVPLRLIQRQMAFMGWQGEARTGFAWKRDADGRQIARAHDQTWRDDYAEAEAFERRAINRERRSA